MALHMGVLLVGVQDFQVFWFLQKTKFLLYRMFLGLYADTSFLAITVLNNGR